MVVIKPIFIDLKEGLVFTVNPGSEYTGVFFVCRLCDRGLSTNHGLATHQNSESHQQQARRMAHIMPVCSNTNCFVFDLLTDTEPTIRSDSCGNCLVKMYISTKYYGSTCIR